VSFWDDFGNSFVDTLKNIGTSTIRMPADMVLDLANLITGTQYQHEYDGLKKQMSDAGVLNTHDSVAKTYYSFLPPMKSRVEAMSQRLTMLSRDARKLLMERDSAALQLNAMLADVRVLAQMSLEAERLLERASQLPYWRKSDVRMEAFQALSEMKTSSAEWDAIIRRLGIATVSVNVVGDVAMLTSVIAQAAAASAALRAGQAAATVAAEGGEVVTAVTRGAAEGVEVLGAVSRVAVIGRLAGRASAVLTVVTIGLDIGLSVAQLENQKQTLEDNIASLARELPNAEQALHALNQESIGIWTRSKELMQSVSPPVSRIEEWSQWVHNRKRTLQVTLDSIIRSMGLPIARSNRNKPFELRVAEVMAVPSITYEQAAAIIVEADAKG
jgi:hypothetical protein